MVGPNKHSTLITGILVRMETSTEIIVHWTWQPPQQGWGLSLGIEFIPEALEQQKPKVSVDAYSPSISQRQEGGGKKSQPIKWQGRTALTEG